jgi:hypothetical protein
MSAPSAIELRQHLLFEKQVLLASRLPDALAEDALEHFQELWGLTGTNMVRRRSSNAASSVAGAPVATARDMSGTVRPNATA